MRRINFIGCGKAGRSLGKLWHQQQCFIIGDVCTQSLKSAEEACNKIGAGRPVQSIAEMAHADVYVIATPDRCIKASATALEEHVEHANHIVMHLSGALESSILKTDIASSQKVVSVHPVHSFSDNTDSKSFSGAWCGSEGDVEAKRLIAPAFEQIGGKVFEIETGKKLAYHAACVMVSNYVNALVGAGMDGFQLAGIKPDTARALIEPILVNTVNNIVKLGPVDSLTGPIKRGDWDIVRQEQCELDAADPLLGEIYRALGKATERLTTKPD